MIFKRSRLLGTALAVALGFGGLVTTAGMVQAEDVSGEASFDQVWDGANGLVVRVPAGSDPEDVSTVAEHRLYEGNLEIDSDNAELAAEAFEDSSELTGFADVTVDQEGTEESTDTSTCYHYPTWNVSYRTYHYPVHYQPVVYHAPVHTYYYYPVHHNPCCW